MGIKEKATFVFRHLPDGNVVGEIIDEKGVVLESRKLGVMSEEEFESILDLVTELAPNLAGKLLPTIELTGN